MKITKKIITIPRTGKRLLALAHDAFYCTLTLWVALSLRLEQAVPLSELLFGSYQTALLLSLCAALPIFVANGLYRAVFRYSGHDALKAIVRSGVLYLLVFAAVVTGIGLQAIPRTIGVLQPLLLVACIGLSRYALRQWLMAPYMRQLRAQTRPYVLVFGAGSAGRQIASAIQASGELHLVGFVDDDHNLQRHRVNGVLVYARADLRELVRQQNITEILVAVPSMRTEQRQQLLQQLVELRVHVRTVPPLADVINGRLSLSDLRELDIEDLLGRSSAQADQQLLDHDTRGKVVLVTGAGGSIGSELCRQVLKRHPAKLLLLEHSEFALYQIDQELQQVMARKGMSTQIIPLLASVANPQRVDEIMSTWQPHTVYHAAAYKHVPLVEHNPAEGIRNNVWGTWICAVAAARHGVTQFVLISTDKAVRPTNIMGCSKRLAEMLLQALQAAPAEALCSSVPGVPWPEAQAATPARTCYSMVRFGNVLGSSGSVVPLFRKQIREGGPITLTHPDITRYFMTIPEAAQLVVQAGAMATGGDVFVLDMGEPVRIFDLAQRIIELSGKTLKDEQHPNGEIEIKTTGLRPGEKLYEELLIGNSPQPTAHAEIMKAQEAFLPWQQLYPQLKTLDLLLQLNDAETIKTMLAKMVPDYAPMQGVVDWVYMEEQSHLNADVETEVVLCA